MKLTFLLLGGLFSLLLTASAGAELHGEIESILNDKLLQRAAVGVKVVRLGSEPGTSAVVYQHNSTTPLMPASNMKVITTSTSLDLLGPGFKFQTLLVQHGRDLILVGDGDPTFGDNELLKKVGWTSTTVFANWAQQLKKNGMDSFDNVLVDDSVFDETFTQPHWDPAQLHNKFMAQTAGLTLNCGAIDFYLKTNGPGKVVSYATNPPTRYVSVQNACVGGGQNAIVLDRQRGSNSIILRGSTPTSSSIPATVTIHDPALYGVTVLAETLVANGVRLNGKMGRDRSVRAKLVNRSEGYNVLAIHETPLLQVISRANKDSVNPYAEALCKRNGYAATGQSGSWESGCAAAAAFLKKAGAEEDQFQLDDGCGLSRQDKVSPDAMMSVLVFNYFGPHRDAFVSALAVGGVDGTLDDRFKNDLRGRVFAKSGYIVGVSALSGYLKAKDGNTYAFSILMNGLPKGVNSRAKELQERMLHVIDSQRGN